jgi:hypothetical protein
MAFAFYRFIFYTILMPHSEFTLVYGNFIQRKNRTIEAADISTEYLSHVLEEQQALIEEGLLSRPVILLTRLALADREAEALSLSGLDNNTGIHTASTEINDVYLPYWLAIVSSGQQPEVRSRFAGGYANFDGTWLGVARPR